MIEIAEIGKNLECREHGIWFSKNRSQISYPEDRNVQCFTIEENSFWFQHRNNSLVEVMRLFPPKGTIFDIGGGNGYVSLAIKRAGMDTVLVEPSYEGAINAHNRGLNSIICSTFEGAGFKPKSIPAIGIFDVLEHIENDHDFIRMIKTVLVPNGRLYITLPAYNFLWSIEDDHSGHYRRYTLRELTTKLESAGFEIDLKTYIFGLLPVPIFLLRTIPTKLGFRTTSQFGRIRSEHGQRKRLLGRLVELALNLELKALRAKKTIPIGGSCLVVARSAKIHAPFIPPSPGKRWLGHNLG
jgi:SAM-dependent methyltransferase